MDDLREDMRKLQRQNRKLWALLTPIN
jgi:hypothetical protein